MDVDVTSAVVAVGVAADNRATWEHVRPVDSN